MQISKKKNIHPIVARISKESRRQLKLAENYVQGFAASLDNLETFDFEYKLGFFKNHVHLKKQ